MECAGVRRNWPWRLKVNVEITVIMWCLCLLESDICHHSIAWRHTSLVERVSTVIQKHSVIPVTTAWRHTWLVEEVSSVIQKQSLAPVTITWRHTWLAEAVSSVIQKQALTSVTTALHGDTLDWFHYLAVSCKNRVWHWLPSHCKQNFAQLVRQVLIFL